MSSQLEEIIPLFQEDDVEQNVSIKWQQSTSKYEIYTPVLRDLELAVMIPHCIEVKQKIDSAVSTATHKGPSYFQVFPRTLSNVLLTIWTQLIADTEPSQDEDGFTASLKAFIASHSTDEDRHELVNQIRAPKKPLKNDGSKL